QFLERNQTLATQVQRISNWLETIKEMITFLFTRLDAHYEECQTLFDLLSTLHQEITVAKADDHCDLKVIQNILEDRLAKDIQAGSFFTGSITFCSMMPMRNVPAKFIGLLGMREDAYPRQEIKTEFSQFTDGPRIGDRSQREDDRYLFLESILAARSQLYISYTGIDSQTLNQEPASIVVEELLDTLDDYYAFPNEESARQALVSTEPLQAFSPSNFEGDAPQSFSEENLRAAQAMIQTHSVSEGLNIQSSSDAPDYPDSVSIDQLLKFFLNPSQYWLSEILETNFPYHTQNLEDSEPIEPNSLEVYQWGQAILNDPDILSGKSEYKLESLLPVGALGKLAYERLAPELRVLLEQWNALPYGDPVTVQLDQQLEDLHISGAIAGATNRNYKHMRFGKIRSADVLSGWIQHLFLCQHLETSEFETHLIGKEATYSFKRAKEPKKYLLDLKQLFVRGNTSPLPFFVQAAYTFSKASLRQSPRARKKPIDLAFGEFTKLVEFPFLIQGEAYNPYNQLCFPDPSEALAQEFEEIAFKIFAPAIEHMEGGIP
ncbi:MAG: exodeoxyribonuclease V subunit gamma, partial [Opitutales bacterium]|nr:exodeoxyribonuclease V subunit gamma [Opitutales bacterium]